MQCCAGYWIGPVPARGHAVHSAAMPIPGSDDSEVQLEEFDITSKTSLDGCVGLHAEYELSRKQLEASLALLNSVPNAQKTKLPDNMRFRVAAYALIENGTLRPPHSK